MAPRDRFEPTLWTFSLDCDVDALQQAERLLTPAERERATRFRQPHHRRRFVIRRSMRRVVLSKLLGVQAEALRIERSDTGKPVLAGDTLLCFNSSHSRHRCAIVTAAFPVGVDIEAADRPIDHFRFARRWFTDAEYTAIAEANDSERAAAFFNCWTGKEAYLKTLGLGLARNLNSFCVSCAAGAAPGLLWDHDETVSPDSFRFARLTDGEFVITVVCESNRDVLSLAHYGVELRSVTDGELVSAPPASTWRNS